MTQQPTKPHRRVLWPVVLIASVSLLALFHPDLNLLGGSVGVESMTVSHRPLPSDFPFSGLSLIHI